MRCAASVLQRLVATFAMKQHRTLGGHFAVPSMGAQCCIPSTSALPRADRLCLNEAEDRILVDLSLARLLAPVLPKYDTVHTMIAVGEGDAPLREAGKTVLRFAELIDARIPDFSGRRSMELRITPAVLPAIPKALYAVSFRLSARWRYHSVIGVGSSDKVLPIVPMFHANGWGLP